MKKIAILTAVALCLGFASCDNVDMPNPPAQSNPQEALFSADDLDVIVDPATATTADLTALNNSSQLMPIAEITKLENLPAGYEPVFVAHVANNPDMNNAKSVNCTVSEGKIGIDPDSFNGVLRSFSKDVVDQTVYVTLTPYLQSGASTVEIEKTYGPYTLTATPFAPTNVIEEAYYLILSTNPNSWNLGGAIRSTHSATNVYDDPEFKFIFNATADQIQDGLYWKVIPASVYAMTDWTSGEWYGTTFDDQSKSSGTLAKTNAVPGVNISVSGSVQLTINMDEMTFEYIQAIPYFYTPGNSNGWDAPKSQTLVTNDFQNYFGMINVDGEFKFNPDTGWNGRDFGAGADFVYNTDSPVITGSGVADGGNNIKVPVNGVYWITLNYITRATNLVIINSVGLIGDATPGGWGDETALTPSADFLTWTGTVHFNGNGEYKIRCNNGWDLSFGGQPSDLTHENGSNMATPGEGNYEVTVNFAQHPYSVNLVKK
ncbi:MAG: hypothetical protein NC098_08845 [Lachnoclostridium sp.]|nr:hypothetical protein [Lachnoclostridium sp.]